MHDYKEVIVALIAVLGGVVPYLVQRNKELNLKIASRKRGAYTAFLRNFTESALSVMKGEEWTAELEAKKDRERLLARDKLLLFGSDEVIKAYDAWIRHSGNNDDTDTEGVLVSELLLAIRSDILGGTELTTQQIENLNPYLRG